MKKKPRPKLWLVIGQLILAWVALEISGSISDDVNFMTLLAIYFFILAFVTMGRWWGWGIIPAALMGDSPAGRNAGTDSNAS